LDDLDQRGDYDDTDVDPTACRALWCSVVREFYKVGVRPSKSDNYGEVSTARNWFGTRDFYTVCALAGVDAAGVLEKVHAALREQGAV